MKFTGQRPKDLLVMMADGSELRFVDWVAAIRAGGMWGFTTPKNRIVHWWSDGQRSEAELVRLFAHELGHNAGKPLRGVQAEEDRADSYADVAVAALRKLRQAVRS